MGAVVGSVALAEAGAPAPVSPPTSSDAGGKTVSFGDGRVVSFADDAPKGDRAAQILDEVLAGDEQGASEADGTHTPDPAGSTPAPATDDDKTPVEVPKKDEPKAEPASDIEAAKLRKGFAALAKDKQKLVELQNKARQEIASETSSPVI